MINPSEEEKKIYDKYLFENNIKLTKDDHYIAPMYDKHSIVDQELLNMLEQKRPNYILINIGGGKQEPLGHYLKSNLSYNPAIICTGAAIAILSGAQGKIPRIIDKIYLGWLWRCFSDPTIFIPRYLTGFKLTKMLINEKIMQYKEQYE